MTLMRNVIFGTELARNKPGQIKPGQISIVA